VAAEGVTAALWTNPLSPDGRWVLLRNGDGRHALYPIEGGEPRPVLGLTPDDRPAQWSTKEHCVLSYRPGELPVRLERVNLVTGARTLVHEIAPADKAGVLSLGPLLVTPDGETYVYGFRRLLSDLYVVEGLR